ncbi:MAG: hypothetical protein JNL82_32205 [Myxococcales bacterium]|nr:hypothetical protein [Myxococcales bacterium]
MTGASGPRYIVESIELDSWSAVVRDDGRRAVFGSATANALQPGPGPGELTWQRGCEGGLPALRATWGTGHFLILPVSSAMFALFFAMPERDQPLAVGSVEGLKHAAASQRSMFAAPPPSPVPRSSPAVVSQKPTFAAPPAPPAPASRPAPTGQSKAVFLKGLIKR